MRPRRLDRRRHGRTGRPQSGQHGITDWAGWAFVDKQFWLEADDQDRSLFHRGVGTVMVADPDEWQETGTSNRLSCTTFLSRRR